jgi:hypothetical protein
VTALIAYIPFVHPIAWFHDWWYLLLVPLSFGVSVVYKALRMPRLGRFWQEVAIMTTQVVLAMIGLAICLVLLVQVLIPALPVG